MSKRSEQPDPEWEHRLGRVCCNYCSPASPQFDLEFRAKLLELLPTRDVKQELLDLGRRVRVSDALYSSYQHICKEKTAAAYDASFAQEYEALYPSRETVASKKFQLLNLGRRIQTSDDLYKFFNRRCTSDLVFRREYDALYPPAAGVDVKKSLLLGFGRRVVKGDELFAAAYAYMAPAKPQYDPEFTKEYNRLYPSKRDMAAKKAKKAELLSLGYRVTTNAHPLYRNLRSYTAPSPKNQSYDPEFTKLYNEKYPPVQGPEAAKQKKRQLLALGRRPKNEGEEKPLYDAMHRFTSPNSPAFDPDFTEQFRANFTPERTTGEGRRKRQELLTMGRRVRKDDPLYTAWNNYRRDPEFAKLYDETYPPKRRKE